MKGTGLILKDGGFWVDQKNSGNIPGSSMSKC